MRIPTLFAAALVTVSVPAAVTAQSSMAPANPVTMSLKGLHDIGKGYLSASAKQADDKLFAYRPNENVRTFGQILAHVANAQFMFCSLASGEKNPSTEDFEKTRTTKAQITAALDAAFAYCEKVYGAMTDAGGTAMRDVFGNKMAASAVLAFNSSHNFEHYGNLVTYMRINGMVPPSSQSM